MLLWERTCKLQTEDIWYICETWNYVFFLCVCLFDKELCILQVNKKKTISLKKKKTGTKFEEVLHKEDIQMDNLYMKRFSASLIIGKCKLKLLHLDYNG